MSEGCRYCKSDEESINKIDMDNEVDFRLNLGNGQIETEVILGLGDEDIKPYLEVYRFYTGPDGTIHDGFDKSMQVPIYFCPFCGRKL
jgi:hypothetical protein